MITLKNVKLINFLSHKETEVSFEANDKLLISGKSGSGKSTIVEGIIFCLYGKGRSENRNMVRRGEKGAEVTLVLQDGAKTYKIVRSVAAKGSQKLEVTVEENGETTPLPTIGLKDAQDWIERKLLKSSYLLFINSIASPQDNIDNFVKQTAAKRKDMLLEMVDTEDIELYYNRAKNELNSTAEKLIRVETEAENIKHLISTQSEMASKVGEYDDAIFTLSQQKLNIVDQVEKLQEHKYAIRSSLDSIAAISSRWYELTKEVISAETGLARYSAEVASYRSFDISAVECTISTLIASRSDVNEKDELLAKRSNLMQQRANLSYKMTSTEMTSRLIDSGTKELMEQLSDKSSFCEHLGRNCPKLDEARQKRIAKLEQDIELLSNKKSEGENANKEIAKQMEALELEASLIIVDMEALEASRACLSELNALQVKKDTHEAKKGYIESLEAEMVEINNKISKLTAEKQVLDDKVKDSDSDLLKAELAEKDATILSLTKQVEAIDSELAKFNSLKGSAESAKALVERANADLAKLSESAKELYNKKNCLELVKDAFGSKGVKTIVIDYIIPKLEENINDILSKLSDFRVSVDTLRELSTGEGMSEGLFINIINGEGEVFDYSNYSGGEKVRISYAITEALANFQRCNFRLLDEVVNGLDDTMIDSFGEVLFHLNQSEKQIICISHIESIKQLFPRALDIIKQNGVSVIK